MSARNGLAANDSAISALMPRWLAGEALDDLPPLSAPTSAECSPQFTALEQVAIATALATPDICLIHGDSSERRVRVAHAIASRAALRGDRVLVLSPSATVCGDSASADCARCDMCAGKTATKGRQTFWSWLTGLLTSRPATAASADSSNIVSATYRDSPTTPFDFVVAADAHTLSDAEMTSVAARGRRCTWIGTLSSQSSFRRLWQNLAFEPWTREGERIICRLRPVADHNRDRLEREPVADRPEIELRILAEPSGEPQLVEVLFPQGMQISEAKNYVFEQLGEAPICNGASSGLWSEAADGIRLDLDESASGPLSDVPLANGIRELVEATGNSWTTCALQFARSAGWNRESAAGWVEQHCGRRHRGRTVRLDQTAKRTTETTVDRAVKTIA